MTQVFTAAVATGSWMSVAGFSFRWLLALAFAIAAAYLGRRLLVLLAADEPVGFDRSWGGLGGSEGGWRATRALVYLVLLLASLGGLVLSVPANPPAAGGSQSQPGDDSKDRAAPTPTPGAREQAEDSGETAASAAASPTPRPTGPAPTPMPTPAPAATPAGAAAAPSAR